MKSAEMRVTCPNCGEQIPIDDKAYHSIVNEVCNAEVNRRVKAVKEELEMTLAEKADSIRQQAEAENQAELEKARRCFVELREKTGAQISELKAIIDSSEMDKNLAVAAAVKKKDEMIAGLNKDNIRLKEQLDFRAKAAASEMEALKARLENEHLDQVVSLEADKNRIISDLNADISALKAENKYKDDQIISLKDYKARLSTKLLGESLEQHCEQSYDHLIRPVIPNAVFEKDTAAGEKGDYIYREYDAAGTELLSILFEMKNEDGLSSSRKKKNNDCSRDQLIVLSAEVYYKDPVCSHMFPFVWFCGFMVLQRMALSTAGTYCFAGKILLYSD